VKQAEEQGQSARSVEIERCCSDRNLVCNLIPCLPRTLSPIAFAPLRMSNGNNEDGLIPFLINHRIGERAEYSAASIPSIRRIKLGIGKYSVERSRDLIQKWCGDSDTLLTISLEGFLDLKLGIQVDAQFVALH
jgi:hypothetical protein